MLEKPALLLIDMQGDFLDIGAPIEIARGRDIIPNLKNLLDKTREVNIPIIHIITIHSRDKIDWELLEPERVPAHCIEGTKGADITDELKPREGEYVVVKKRYSGFYQTGLEMILRRLGVKTLIVTGVTTECCVRCTAFDGYFRDFKVIVPEDCTDSSSEGIKKASLQDITACIGDVVMSKIIIEALH